MAFENRELADIREQDIVQLVEVDRWPEDERLDYKEALPGGSTSEKKDFLRDVCALANAGGGHIIYGVREERGPDGRGNGVPEEICGLGTANPDTEKMRLMSMIAQGLEPRLHGAGVQALQVRGELVIILHVPRSWNSPHMVTFEQDSRFYLRHGTQKMRMNVGQVRDAFLEGLSRGHRVRAFRADRLGDIMAGETPVRLPERPKVVIHLVPMDLDKGLDLEPCASAHRLDDRQHSSVLLTYRHNFDGMVAHYANCASYVQVFRDGAIESVDTESWGYPRKEKERWVDGAYFEQETKGWVSRSLQAQRRLGVAPPVFLMLSLLGVRDHILSGGRGTEHWLSTERYNRIREQNLLLPDIMIDDLDCDVESMIRPALQMVWNACGYEESPIKQGNDGNVQ